mgnify:CR=1 FL=1
MTCTMVIDEDYFIKYLKNELTEEETRRLIAWVKEKKENQDFLFSLKDSYVYLNYESDCKGVNTEHECCLLYTSPSPRDTR